MRLFIGLKKLSPYLWIIKSDLHRSPEFLLYSFAPLWFLRALPICQNWPAIPLVIWFPFQSNLSSQISQILSSMHEGNGFFLSKKLLEKAYFIFELTGPAMVRPASSNKWKAPLEYLASAA